jgi:hypothetical protein
LPKLLYYYVSHKNTIPFETFLQQSIMAMLRFSTLILWICLLSQGAATQGTQIRKRSLQEEQSVEGGQGVDIPAGSPSMAIDPSPVTTDDEAANDDTPVGTIDGDSSPAATPLTDEMNDAEEGIEDGDADQDKDEQGERRVQGDDENDEEAPASSPNVDNSPVTDLPGDIELTSTDSSDNENMDWNDDGQFDEEELEESTEDDSTDQR